MKIVSLLPSATEIVYALGSGRGPVGVTDECDFPPDAVTKPVVSRSALPQGRPLTSREIDAAVRERMDADRPLYVLDTDLIRREQPDVILTQDLCRVCAVPAGHVEEALAQLGLTDHTKVLSLDPSTLDDVIAQIEIVGRLLGPGSVASESASALRERLAARQADSRAAADRERASAWSGPSPRSSPATGCPRWSKRSARRTCSARRASPRAPSPIERSATLCPRCSCTCRAATTSRRPRSKARRCSAHPEIADTPAARNRNVFAVDATSFFSRPGASHRRRARDPGVGGSSRGLPDATRPARSPVCSGNIAQPPRGSAGSGDDGGSREARGAVDERRHPSWRLHRSGLGPVRLDRSDLGLIVPVHRPRARGVRARAHHVAARSVRRRGAVVRACRAHTARPRGSCPARRVVAPVGRGAIHALPARPAMDQLGTHRVAERLAAHLRHRDRSDHAAPAAWPRPGDRARRRDSPAWPRSLHPRSRRDRPRRWAWCSCSPPWAATGLPSTSPRRSRSATAHCPSWLACSLSPRSGPPRSGSSASLARASPGEHRRGGRDARRGRHRARVRADGPPGLPRGLVTCIVRHLPDPGRGARARCCLPRRDGARPLDRGHRRSSIAGALLASLEERGA